jgi:hypothetical protein
MIPSARLNEVTRESLAADMGFRFRALRIASGYPSVAAFARSLGLPVSTARRCEAGRLVGTSRVYVVMHALGDRGVSLDWFVLGDIRRGGRRKAIIDPTSKVVIMGARFAG